MSEPKILIQDSRGGVIAWAKYGVLWRKGSNERLGSFCENEAYDNSGSLLASLRGNRVISITGQLLGELKSIEGSGAYNIYVDGKVVNQCGYSQEMSVGILALLGRELSENI